MVFSDTPHLLKTFLLRRASSLGVIISDRFALEISSRGSSKLTSEFSASEIFVQRLPGSSVTSQRRRQSGGGREGFCSSPCKNDDIEGMLTAAMCLGHLSPCDTTHFSRYSMQKQLRKKETGFYAFLSCLGAGFLCQVLLLWSARAHSWVPSTKWLSQDWGHNFCLALAATNRSQACQSKRVTRTGLRRPSPAPWHPLLWEFRGDKTPLPAAIHQGRAHYFRPNQAEGKNEHPPSMGLLNLWSDLISWRL